MLLALTLASSLTAVLPWPPSVAFTEGQARPVEVLRGKPSKVKGAVDKTAPTPVETAPAAVKATEPAAPNPTEIAAKLEAERLEQERAREKAERAARAKDAKTKQIEEHGRKVRAEFNNLNDALGGE